MRSLAIGIVALLLVRQESADAYFKFKKGTCWVYESTQGTRKKKSKMAMVVARQEGDTVVVNWERYSEGSDEPDVAAITWQSKDGFLWLEPGGEESVPVFKLGSKKGDSWKSPGEQKGQKTQFEVRHEGLIELKVPAGTYKDVLHVSVKADEKDKVVHIFLAPKVGLVKLEVEDEMVAELKEVTERKEVKEAVSARVKANERNAAASLKTLGTAEADFRSNDRDNNRVLDFWTGDVSGLYRCTGDGKTAVKLIELSIAEADTAPVHLDFMVKHTVDKPAPKSGYFYRAIAKDEQGEPYARDTDNSGHKCRNARLFAFCAYPAEYGKSGTRTFIINEENTVRWSDTGGKPVEQWPKDEDLGKSWKKMD